MARRRNHKDDGIGDWFQNNDAGRIIGQITGLSANQAAFEAQGEGQIRGARRAGNRIGRMQGETQAYNFLGGDQATYDYSAMRGRSREISRMGSMDGRNSVRGFAEEREFSGQSSGSRAPRFQDNGRGGPRDLHDEDANGRDTSSRSAPSQGQDHFRVASGKFSYEIDNDGTALTRGEQQRVGAALANIQEFHVFNRDQQLGALQDALKNGLDPDAMIIKGSGRDKGEPMSLDDFVKKGMTGKNQQEALAMLRDAREHPYHAPQASVSHGENRSSGQAADTGASLQPKFDSHTPNLRSPVGVNDISELVNSKSVSVNGQQLSDSDRVRAIQEAMSKVTDGPSAKRFHAELAANPNFAANYTSLVRSGLAETNKPLTADELQSAAMTIAKATQDAGRMDPDGVNSVSEQLANGARANPNAAAVSSRLTSAPTTAELAAISIDDVEMNKRLQAAVSQQKGWDDMAKGNPIAGMFMMLLRPLLQAMNPDSDPMRILAEAQEKGVPISAPEAVKGKLAQALGKDSGIQTAQTAAATQDAATSPDRTGPAPNPPTPQQLTADAPTGEKVQQMAEQGKAAASNPPQALDIDKTLAELNALDPRVQKQIRHDLRANGADGVAQTSATFTKADGAAIVAAIQEGDLTKEELGQVTRLAIAQKGAFIIETPAATALAEAKVEEIAMQSKNASLVVEIKESARALGIPVSGGNMALSEADYTAIEQADIASQIPASIRKPDPNAPTKEAPVIPDFANMLNGFTPPADKFTVANAGVAGDLNVQASNMTTPRSTGTEQGIT